MNSIANSLSDKCSVVSISLVLLTMLSIASCSQLNTDNKSQPRDRPEVDIIAGGVGTGFHWDGGLAIESPLDSPYSIVVGQAGDIYFSDLGSHSVGRISVDGRIHKVVGTGKPGSTEEGHAATEAQVSVPVGLALDSRGALYIAALGNHIIWKVDANGVLRRMAGTGEAGYSGDGGDARLATLNMPGGVATDLEGRVIIADSANHRIRIVGSDGVIHTLAGTGEPGYSGDGLAAVRADLGSPDCPVATNDGSVLFVDRPYRRRNAGWPAGTTGDGKARIRKIDSKGVISTVVGGGSQWEAGVAGHDFDAGTIAGVSVDNNGRLVFLCLMRHAIFRLDESGIVRLVAQVPRPGGIYPPQMGDAPKAAVVMPANIAVALDGSMLITDQHAAAIYRLRLPNQFRLEKSPGRSRATGGPSDE